MQESVRLRIFVSKKGMIRVHPTEFAPETFGKRPKVSCLKKPKHAGPEIWGCMYNVLPYSAKGTRNRTRNWIPVQPKKVAKKLVSSDFAKILEYESSN
jgi:hypothetical protein